MDEADPSNPDPGGPDDIVARIDGTYEIHSRIDLSTSTAGLAGVLNSLDNLSADPAGTLIDILEASGVDFLDSVPGPLKDLFASQVNNFIRSQNFGQDKVTKLILDYGTMIGQMTQNFDAVSEMTVGQADAAGNATASHGVVAIQFNYAGRDMVVEVANAAMSPSISVNAASNGGLNIGSHELQLPVGKLALEALKMTLQQDMGSTSIAGALGTMIDCTALATSVGDIQISGFTLVSTSQIDNLCEQGLALVAAKLEQQFGNLNIDLAVVGGTGTSQAASGKVMSMRGNWDLTLDSQTLASSFEGSRMQ